MLAECCPSAGPAKGREARNSSIRNLEFWIYLEYSNTAKPCGEGGRIEAAERFTAALRLEIVGKWMEDGRMMESIWRHLAGNIFGLESDLATDTWLQSSRQAVGIQANGTMPHTASPAERAAVSRPQSGSRPPSCWISMEMDGRWQDDGGDLATSCWQHFRI